MKRTYIFKVEREDFCHPFIALAVEESLPEAEQSVRDTFGHDDNGNPLTLKLTLAKNSVCVPTSGCATYVGLVDSFTK